MNIREVLENIPKDGPACTHSVQILALRLIKGNLFVIHLAKSSLGHYTVQDTPLRH